MAFVHSDHQDQNFFPPQAGGAFRGGRPATRQREATRLPSSHLGDFTPPPQPHLDPTCTRAAEPHPRRLGAGNPQGLKAWPMVQNVARVKNLCFRQ